MADFFRKLYGNRIAMNIFLVFLLLGILLAIIWTRSFIGSMNNYSKGEELFHDKKYIKAITFFDRAMHWYTPFNPYIEKSAEYLWQIGEQAEHDGDIKLSLIAVESIRNSYYSARSFYSPGIEWISRCENKIGQINNEKNALSRVAGTEVDGVVTSSVTKYNDPGIFWVIVLEMGLLGWIGSMISFCISGLRSIKESGNLISGSYWIILAGVFYSLWIMGMINA